MRNKSYLKQLQARDDECTRRGWETAVQFMIDLMMITLNSPEYMGKDVFGEKRILQIVDGMKKEFQTWQPALDYSDEADYYQAKLDERLQSILKSGKIDDFRTRYDWIRQKKLR